MIVGGTREACAKLYTAIVELQPEWHSDDLAKGKIKVVYSVTPSDVPPVSDHVRRDSANATVKERLKDVHYELELVIVKDMMPVGHDSPQLHSLYLDRPIKGALLMQRLAGVNRTFRAKDGLLANRLVKAEVNPGPSNQSRGLGSVCRLRDAAGRCTVPPLCRVPP
jgi:type I restriction enzyme R subunit